MKKVFRVIKNIARGIGKGAKDVLPIPTKEAENRIYEGMGEFLAQKITARGTLIIAVVYAVDKIFKLNLFT
jgi:hypothetical protein